MPDETTTTPATEVNAAGTDQTTTTPPDQSDVTTNDQTTTDASDNTEDVDDGSEPGFVEHKTVKVTKEELSDNVDDIDDDAFNLANKVADKRVSQIEEQLFDQKVSTELNQVLSENPEFAPFKAKIERYVNHPNRKQFIKSGLPVRAVIAEAMFEQAQKIGAKKAMAAKEEADRTRTPASSPAQTSSSSNVDFSKMSAQEVSRVAELVKSGRYTP